MLNFKFLILKSFSSRKTSNREASRSCIAGFTILEVLIAVAVLVLGIVAVLTMFPLSLQVQASAKMVTMANQLAQEKIEEIIAQSYDSVSSEPEQTLSPPFDSFFRKTQVDYYDPVNSATTSENSGIKRVKVTVSWKSSLGASKKSLDLVTLIASR